MIPFRSCHAALFVALVCAGCSAATNGAGTGDAAVTEDLAAIPDLAQAFEGAPPDLAADDLAMKEISPPDLVAFDLAAIDAAGSGDLAMLEDLANAEFDLPEVRDLAVVSDLRVTHDFMTLADLSILDGPPCVGGPIHFAWDGGIAGLNDPFADRVISFQPGANAGFGQNNFPRVVLGPPDGAGANLGSLNVLSLGKNGVIVLALDDIGIIDGPGPDLLVFENPTVNFRETGWVAVSDDGVNWHEWPCNPADGAHGFPGCAGVNPVYSNAMNGISPTDPAKAGGDAFDLKTIGVARARYVRIRDSGDNVYNGVSGGFDLDAIAVVNGAPISCW